jgi:hypothetical protein
MSNVFISKSDFTITVKKEGGRITSTAPMTVKNQIRELRSIEDFDDVNTTQKQDGATFIYNATTGKYDVKLYNDDPLLNVQNLYVTTLWANNSRGTNGQVLLTNGNTTFWANSASITVNNANFAYGKRESDLSVNFATFSGTANFAYTANSASFSNAANFASVANNSTFAYGKRESDLSVNFATFSGSANYAYEANNATSIGGKGEGSLNVNSATYATFALNAGLANSGVTPGTYGGTSEIPIVTVNQYGIINAISFTAVTGITDFNYNSSNNTFAIHTGANSVFRAAINSVRDFAVTGNLTVSGTTTTVNTENLTVKDAVITLNSGQLTPFNDIGILMQRYAVSNTTNYNIAIAWDEDSRELKFGRVPEDGSDNEISFSQEWMRINETGGAFFLANTQAGNSVIAGTSMVINSVSFTERNYPGEANTATFFNGTIDCGEY